MPRFFEHNNVNEEDFRTIFQKQEAPEDVAKLSYNVSSENVLQSVLDAIMSTGEYKSKGELRRLIQQGAVKIDGKKVTDIEELSMITKTVTIQIGKGKFYCLVPSN